VLKPGEVAMADPFIREVLPKEGVNTLVLERAYQYRFRKPKVTDEPDPLSREDLERVAAAWRAAGIRLIPQTSSAINRGPRTRTAAARVSRVR
jgi:hypothetical protein